MSGGRKRSEPSLRVQVLGDVEAHVEADEIGQAERPHGVIVTEFHRRIYIFRFATPSSSIRIASSPSATPSRDEAKPGTSRTTIGSFFILDGDGADGLDRLARRSRARRRSRRGA